MILALFENSKRTLFYLLALDLLGYVTAFALYRFPSTQTGLPAHWHAQFYALLLFSCLLSLLPLLTQRLTLLCGALGLKLIALLLMGYPLSGNLTVLTVLTAVFIIDAVVTLPLAAGLLCGLLSILLQSLAKSRVLIWEDTILRFSMGDRIFLLFFGFLLLALCGGFKKLLLEHASKIAEYNRLNQAMQRLNRVNLDFQSYAQTVEKESTEQERKRISRELHDIIGYTLTNQLMIIQAVMSLKDRNSSRLDVLLEQAHKQLNEGMEDARTALRQLHNTEENRETGMKQIAKLVKTFEQITGLAIRLELANAPQSLGSRLDDALYRLIQEGMTNAFRHGQATEIKIIFWKEKGAIRISLWDNGTGGGAVQEGLGMKGMRERFAALGGDVTAKGGPEGFTLKAWLPLEE